MGDIIGILSGLVTLTEVVIRGIKVAKTLYQAPEELSVLQVSKMPMYSSGTYIIL
jgi:hypothetical protein